MKNVKWEEFKVGELFKIENTLSFNTNELVSGNQFDYITRTSKNQGVLQKTGFVNSENINKAGIWSLGLLQMDFFYRPNPWYAGQFVRKVIPKIDLNLLRIPFFTSALNKLKPLLLSVLVRNVDKTFLNSELILPATKNGKIDFDFIERFVAEIEAERINKLDNYLSEKVLNNYDLTEQESKALENYENIEWGDFKLGDLFTFKAIKQAKSQKAIPTDDTKNGVPYIVQSTSNNMFSRNVNKQWLIDNNENPVSGNCIVLGVTLPAVSYQPREFGASQVIMAKANWLNENKGIFIVSAISKLMYKFSYGKKPGLQIYKDLKIQLPTKNGKIDFDFMERFIAELKAERINKLDDYLCKKKKELAKSLSR